MTNVVGWGLVLNSTIEPACCGTAGFEGAIKFEPFTVRVNAAPAGLADVGLTLVIIGAAGWTEVIRNVAAVWLNPPPGPGFDAVIWASPGTATSEGKIASAI